MRILYDGFIYHLQKAGGINRYFSELIARLPAESEPLLYGNPQSRIHAPAHPRLKRRGPLPFGRFCAPFAASWSARFDLVHPTYYHLTEPLQWKSLRSPVVLTVYDFVFQRYGHLYERSGKLLAAQKVAIERADLILCISQSTQNDLGEFHPEAFGRSRVVHLGTSKLEASTKCVPPPKPYVLFVGARVFYKNFDLAVRCLALARRMGAEMNFVVAGPPWTASEEQLLQEQGIRGATRLVEYPSDEQLATLYSNALCLLYPSAYEGFGLPPLEAMSLGCPVLALRQSSIPEVVGEGGILVEAAADAVECFADALCRLSNEPALRSELFSSALKWSRKFSWERTATETLDAYRSLIGSGI